MRIRIIFSVLILFLIVLPSSGEIHFPTPDGLIQDIYNYSYPSDASISRYIIIRGESLDYLAGLPLDKYLKLEVVIVEFTEDPAAEDAKKEKIISTVEKNLQHLKNLRKCRNLKYVVLHTGEFLFIRKADGLQYNSSDYETRRKADRLNLERLNMRFGKKMEQILPGITVYAHNWGW